MGIKDLPGPGLKFRATSGPGSFKRKLSNATRYGELKNLRDNQEAIVDVVKKFERAIKLKGGLSRLQRREAWLAIKKKDKTITKGDKFEVQAALKHLGRGVARGFNKSAGSDKTVKASDGQSFLTKEQIKSNIAKSRELGELIRVGQSAGVRFIGGRAANVSAGALTGRPAAAAVRGVKGTMERLGVSRGQIGYALKPGQTRPADKPARQAPLGGTKPIGM